MENQTFRRFLFVGLASLLVIGMAFSVRPASASNFSKEQALVDKARLTFESFQNDSSMGWFRDHLRDAKAVLIFPQVLKGAFVWGASGGSGVLVARNPETGSWSDPAFYTIGSVSFGLQIGGQASEVVLLVMTQNGLDSLYSSHVKFGGDVSVAAGPVGMGVGAPVTADFVAFARNKGLFAGISLNGAVVQVRNSYNRAYYGRDVRPVDIIARRVVQNRGANELIEAIKRAAA